MAGDILDNGVTLTGGCAQLRGWTERLKHELGVPVQVAEEPLQAVARGSGRCVDDFASLSRILADVRRG